jgi:uncharacterized protein
VTEERAWIRLPSSRRLDLLNPTPLDWDDEDLAVGLARTYRWGGHSVWDLPLSVAQHSLTVLAIRRQDSETGLSARSALRELLHDADEGLIGWDPISPLKPHLGADFRAVVARLQAAIVSRYGLSVWSVADKRAHKRADIASAAAEAHHVAGWSVPEIRRTLRIVVPPVAVDPLVGWFGGVPWEPWPPRLAAGRFLAELRRLQREVSVSSAG